MKGNNIFLIIIGVLAKLSVATSVIDPRLSAVLHEAGDVFIYIALALHIANPPDPAAPAAPGSSQPGILSRMITAALAAAKGSAPAPEATLATDAKSTTEKPKFT